MYGRRAEVEPASKRRDGAGPRLGGRYLGDEISAGDWASRHDRYATPLHGRTLDGQAVMMSWHCEDAALNYSVLPQVREEWHAIVDRYRELRHLRRLGDVRLHERRLQAVGRLPGGDRRRDLGAEARRRELGGVGALQARDLRGDAQVRRLDHRLPRRHARGRRRAGTDRDGLRVGGRQAHQARARPQQRHEPRQAVDGRGVRGAA